jgi:hypothetical protein
MSAMDPDGSGEVDFIEFKSWFEGPEFVKAVLALRDPEEPSQSAHGLAESARKRLEEIPTEQMRCAQVARSSPTEKRPRVYSMLHRGHSARSRA